jgi:hypothetical protein
MSTDSVQSGTKDGDGGRLQSSRTWTVIAALTLLVLRLSLTAPFAVGASRPATTGA